MNTSQGSSLSIMLDIKNPSFTLAGTSFIECTAIWALPSIRAFSSSLRNKPLPPFLLKVSLSALSPLVDMATISILLKTLLSSKYSLTIFACRSAKGLSRVASFILSCIVVLPEIHI